MNNFSDQEVKRAVYTALCGGLFYFAGKRLKLDASLALFVGSAIGQILAQDKENEYV